MQKRKSMDINKLVEDIAKGIVDDEESVRINVLRSHTSHIIELTVAKTDIGKIIGRGGRTADAIRAILLCIGAKKGTRYVLQVIDG